jgi:hypothetical protein
MEYQFIRIKAGSNPTSGSNSNRKAIDLSFWLFNLFLKNIINTPPKRIRELVCYDSFPSVHFFLTRFHPSSSFRHLVRRDHLGMSKNRRYHTLVISAGRGSPQTYCLLDPFPQPFSFQFQLWWPGSFLCTPSGHI